MAAFIYPEVRVAITFQSFRTLLGNMVAAAQGACPALLDLNVGSAGRAMLEAVAGLGLWFQFIMLQILSRTRLATSIGPDVDSFVQDFGLARLPGTVATGLVTFTSFTPASQSATITVGATVRTASGIVFDVVEDSTNAAWSASAGGYIRPAGTAAITIAVQCASAGTLGNVAVGAICLLGSAISGIDTVTNTTALTNGSDGESDAALRVRFVSYINSRSRATVTAIEDAVTDVSAGLLYQVCENVDTSGAPLPGNVVVYVDDGSGDVADTLINTVYAAVEDVRPAAVSIQVVRPAIIRPAITMAVTVGGTVDLTTVQATISTSVAAYLNSLAIGAAASYSRFIQIAYAASTDVTNVTGVTLAGGTSDLPATPGTAYRAGTVSFG
ncbi:baseplate J/gp47 family protein [Komagataeibacter sp. FNDCR2]|uniref:baseplate J/gp47 family protein n=1 Tax=Komagataeibacter sp. FNDCR2 TaxID=2878682 RepID=UPI001E40B0A6|nr:baseplate J/gp47 family protein [Komagataeibacter sp. FNDCR2]MCE2574391.1 baseplate J/gp47 family protein [Komagataeibacter sp. FNDCR2]